MLPAELAGKYELRGTLGAGAMGTVLDAFDRMIERRVAVKLVKLPGGGPGGQDAEAAEAHARFRREAQASGRLSHPNIVGVYDYGENADTAWIVMELVEGGTLKSLIDRGERFPVAEVVRVMDQVLAALAYSHGRGVVHRDIKPANIMLAGDRTIKIADFGIARIESSTMTQVGTVMGTPSYMAPEQLRGEPVDARADIWAAGVVLYQLLTGEKPFDGGYSALMHRVMTTEPVPPSQLSVNAPRGFDAVVARALAKRPDDRFPNATAFAEAIRAAATGAAETQGFGGFAGAGKLPGLDDGTLVATGLTPPPRPATPSPPAPPAGGSKMPLVLGGVGALLAAGVAAFFLMPGQPVPPPPAPSQVAAVAPPPTPIAPIPVAPAAEPPAQSPAPVAPPITILPVAIPPMAIPPGANPPVAAPQQSAPPAPGIATPAPTAPPVAAPAPFAPSPIQAPSPPPPPLAQAPAPLATAPQAPAPPAPAPQVPAPQAPAPQAPAPQAPAPQAQTPPASTPTATPPSGPVNAALPTPALTPQTPPAQPTALPAPRMNLSAAAAAAASAAPCSLLDPSATATALMVEGVLRRGGEAQVRRALVDAGVPAGAATLRLVPFDGPYCGALDVIRQVAAEASMPPQVEIIGTRPLQRADLLRLDVVLPPRAGYLYVSYMMKSNEIVHLVPSQPQAAGARVRLGEPTPSFTGWEVDEPYGTDMIVVFASERPLFPQPRPLIERLDDFLPALGEALRNARAQGVRVAARAVVVETVEKR